MRSDSVRALSITALVLGGIAAVPAYAAFTPAVFVSLVALTLAAVSCYRGELRWSVATLVVVTATVLVSPIFTWTSLMQGSLAFLLIVPYALFVLAYVHGLWLRRNSRPISATGRD